MERTYSFQLFSDLHTQAPPSHKRNKFKSTAICPGDVIKQFPNCVCVLLIKVNDLDFPVFYRQKFKLRIKFFFLKFTMLYNRLISHVTGHLSNTRLPDCTFKGTKKGQTLRRQMENNSIFTFYFQESSGCKCLYPLSHLANPNYRM